MDMRRRPPGRRGLEGGGHGWGPDWTGNGGIVQTGGRRTYRVVLEHAHGRRRARARELVEEARHGHREEAHRDDAGFHCSHTRIQSAFYLGGGGAGMRTFLGHGLLCGLSWPVECRCGRGRRATGEV